MFLKLWYRNIKNVADAAKLGKHVIKDMNAFNS